MKMECLSVLDFSCLGIDKSESSINADNAKILADTIIDAFSTTGFVYLTNHGIPGELIDDFKLLSEKFFSLPWEIKKKYVNDRPHGYIGPNTERPCPSRPADLKETFEGCPFIAEDKWPVEVTGFKEIFMSFYLTCKKLACRVLYAIAIGLDLKTDDLFAISPDDTYDSFTNIRMNNYPPVFGDVAPGQLRCNEHTDFGILSLVFQETGGLEVNSLSGGWIRTPPVPGAVLVNIADMLERRTSGKLLSTLHRVPLPDEENRKKESRSSAVFFLHPPHDTVVTGLDTNDKTPPITAKELYEMRNRSNIY